MLKRKKPPNSLTLLCPPLENGRESGLLIPPEPLGDTIDTLFLTAKKQKSSVPRRKKFAGTLFTPESLPESSLTTLKDKLLSCKEGSLPIPSSTISVPESTSNVQVLKPYWNSYSKEISKKLWLPTKTDFPGSASTFFSGSSHTSTPFWNLSTNPIQNQTCLKTSWKFLPSLQPVIMDQESMLEKREKRKERIQKAKEAKKPKEPKELKELKELKEPKEPKEPKGPKEPKEAIELNEETPNEPELEREVIKGRPITRKVHIYPNQQQKKQFRQYFGTHRYFYNETVKYINAQYVTRKQEFNASPTCILCTNPKVNATEWFCQTHKASKKVKLPWNISLELSFVRSKVMKLNRELSDDEKWQKEIPFSTKEYGIIEALTAFKSAITNKKCGNIDRFDVGLKSFRDIRKTFLVDKRAISNKSGNLVIFKTKMPDAIKVTKRNKKLLPEVFDFNCQVLYDKKQYFLLVPSDEPIQTKKPSKYESIALDPGVRTFQTGYSAEGVLLKSGEAVSAELEKLYDRLDCLKSQKSKNKGIKKNKLKDRIWKLQTKIKNKINNLHNQFGNFLTTNFENILLPEFGTSKMQESDILPSETKRRMAALSHSAFKAKLKGLCCRDGRQLYIVNECYTTQTCGVCGTLNQIGGSKVYSCKCGYEMDRDSHSARNILLKHIRE